MKNIKFSLLGVMVLVLLIGCSENPTSPVQPLSGAHLKATLNPPPVYEAEFVDPVGETVSGTALFFPILNAEVDTGEDPPYRVFLA